MIVLIVFFASLHLFYFFVLLFFRSGSISTTKLICFTRESGLIHKCPPEYFPGIIERNTKDITESEENEANSQKRRSLMDESLDVLRHIWHDQSKFMFLKLSTAHSQEILQEKVKRFLESNCDVFIIVINSQQIHKRMVNHLRIMIEDEERCKGNCQKMFVLLFQIAPQQFYTRVYPALFLQGWDHHYLDSIASVKLTPDGLKEQVVNIELWFKLTCLKPERQTLMTDSLKQLLEEAVPVVVSKLVIPTSTHFSPEVDASSKTKSVKRLFSGDKKEIGNILLKRFCLLWNPTLIAEYIDSAANIGYSSKSTLNIIETVETTFRFLFFDFLIYMLSCIAAGLNLDWIFDSKDLSEGVFYRIMEFFPCPALYLLPTHCARLQTHLTCSDKKTFFPFFNEISDAMDEVVKRCKGFGLEDDIQDCDNPSLIQIHLKVESRIDVVAMKQLAIQITTLMDIIIKRRLNQGNEDLKEESQGRINSQIPDDDGDHPSDSDSSHDKKCTGDGYEKRINSLLVCMYV